MDAMAYITKIMDKMAVLFDPSDDIDEEPPEEDYDILDCDKMMSEEDMGFVIL
jgi:hypothetical protein